MASCTCSGCGRRFTSLSGFDKHQDVDYRRRRAVVCKDPMAVGLAQRSDGSWSLPAPARVFPTRGGHWKALRASAEGSRGISENPVP